MKEIKYISVSKLTHKSNRTNKGDLEALADNITTYGLQHPLLVTACNGKYEIIDGRRRFEAVTKLIGFQTVPCIVLSKKEASEDLALVLNTYRLNHNPVELYNLAAKYVKDELKGDPDSLRPELIKLVAEKLNIDIHATCRVLNIGRLDKEVKQLLLDNKIPLRLALITLTLEKKPLRKWFCSMCIRERPSTKEALDKIRQHTSYSDSEPYRDLDYAPFDTEECEQCRHRGYRNKSLFEDVPIKKDYADRYCWNIPCYQKKENQYWSAKITEVREKLGLKNIKKASANFSEYECVVFQRIVPENKKTCTTCKQVKLYSNRGNEAKPYCPKSCVNIKQTTRTDSSKKKPKTKIKKEYTKGEKRSILEERFGLAARKFMAGYFFDAKKPKEFAKSKVPKSYKRILFFVGCDAHTNPFQLYDLYYDPDRYSKREKLTQKCISQLNLVEVAKYNIERAARHLWSYDRANVTPERIDKAITLLYGETKWCKTHYKDIVAKLSKRSKQFLGDVKPWKPAWSK